MAVITIPDSGVTGQNGVEMASWSALVAQVTGIAPLEPAPQQTVQQRTRIRVSTQPLRKAGPND